LFYQGCEYQIINSFHIVLSGGSVPGCLVVVDEQVALLCSHSQVGAGLGPQHETQGVSATTITTHE